MKILLLLAMTLLTFSVAVLLVNMLAILTTQ